MPLPILQGPCTGGCGNCADGPTISAGACESLEGSGTLWGFGKFIDPNDGDWNLRKFLRKDSTGEMSLCEANAPFCPSPASWDTFGIRVAAYAVDITPDVGSSSSCDGYKFSATSGACGANTSESACSSACGVRNFDPDGCHAAFGLSNTQWGSLLDRVITATTDTVTGKEVCTSIAGVGDLSAKGNGVTILTVPDTVAAALARGSATAGSSCRTSPGSIGSGGAGSTDTISISGTRSVKVTFTLANVTTGTWTFKVDLDIYNTSDVFQNSEEDEITIELEAGDITDGEATYEYHVPVRDGEKVEFAGVRDLAAA